jgi:hypothetical protein
MNLFNDAGFFFGVGLMGVLAGFGIGGKSPNKWALLVGAGALFRANQLNPLVDITPTDELYDQLPDLPSLPFSVPAGTQR